MNLKKIYRRFKIWQTEAFDWSFDKNKHHHCVNCENDFVGNYCPHCSQKVGVGKITWESVIRSTAEVWGMHNRSLLFSLWQLMFRPGHFISDYINGKRQVSFPPVKMLVIMGIVGAIVDHMFTSPETTNIFARNFEGSSPVVKQYFTWLESNPGWGWLSIVCCFIVPTWCLFRYAPRNARHSLPQGFFIQVFMSLQVLIVDDLADFFGDFFYILVPMCYVYDFGQLFGYRFWGNLWRVLTMLFSGFMFALMVISVTELLTIGPGHSFSKSLGGVAYLLLLSVVPMLAGTLISKFNAKRRLNLQT